MKRYSYNAGDKVAYNHSYLKAVQGDKEIADMRGTVVTSKTIKPGLSLVTVCWNTGETRKSMSTNLCLVTNNGIMDATE